jgi:hypothetical protein
VRWRHHVPIHGWRQALTAVVLLLPLLALAVIMVRGSRSADVPNLKAPKGSPAALPPPTTLGDLSKISLAAVRGTTTTVGVRTTGTSKLAGLVSGPAGPVPAATVHIERLDGAASFDMGTGPDGRYELPGVAGGPYRVRAFQSPSLAQTKPTVLFVTDGQTAQVDLTVEEFSALAVTSAVAPSPPIVDEPFTLAVRLATRSVGSDGVVRSTPLAGVSVVLLATGSLKVQGGSSTTSGLDGVASYVVTCTSSGPLGAAVMVQADPLKPDEQVPLALPDCTEFTTTTLFDFGSDYTVPPPDSSSDQSTTTTAR